MRTLYAPIYEPGDPAHATALRYKRGLYNALAARGPVHDFDYLANDPATLYDGFAIRINDFQPDLVLTQLHAADLLSPDEVRALKALRPGATWVNWSGDSWAHSLTAPGILALARAFDLWLVAAPDALPVYTREGIRAAYWQIAYEEPVANLPDTPRYDVVWLANVINDRRRTLMERLKRMDGVAVGIFGDWERSDGRCVYDFPMQRALYRNATLAIADNVYQDTQHYISDRPMQTLASGGAMLLHQRVPNMREISYGWEPGEHYVEWQDADHLEPLIRDWLRPERQAERAAIVARGQSHALKHHSFDRRVEQLVDELLPALEGVRS